MRPRLARMIGSALTTAPDRDAKQQFRQHIQRSLRACLRRRFSLEEAFGVIFAETLQEVPLTGAEESELFDELLSWARQTRQLFAGYSTGLSGLSTGFRPRNKENLQSGSLADAYSPARTNPR